MISPDKLIKKLEWLIQQSEKNETGFISSGKVKEYISDYKNDEEQLIEDMYNEHNKNRETILR